MVLGTSLRLSVAALAGFALVAIGPASPAHAVAVPAPDALAAATVAVQRVATVAAAVVRVVRGDTSWGLAARYCGSGAAHETGVRVRSPHGATRAPAAIWPGDWATVSCAPTPTVTRAASSTGWVAPLAGTLFVVGDCRVGGRGGHWLAQRTGHLHQGVDFGRPSGTPIRAVAAGVVSVNKAQTDRYGRLVGAGWYVAVRHAGNVTSDYMHLRARSTVRVGTRVAAGQVVWPAAVNPSRFLRAHGVRVGGC